MPMLRVTSENLKAVITENVRRDAALMTDEYAGYRQAGELMADHRS